MTYPRAVFESGTFPSFSAELPPGLLFDAVDGSMMPRFPFATPFAAIIAVNGPAFVVFSALAASNTRSVLHLVNRCAAERGYANPGLSFDKIGGETVRHPALLAELAPGRSLAAFEDGGMAIVMEAVSPPGIWADYGPFLEGAIRSVELLKPAGPTLPIQPGQPVPKLASGEPSASTLADRAFRADAERRAQRAAALIADNRFDEAEQLVVDNNPSAEAHGRLSLLYEDRLAAIGNAAGRAAREALYRRALRWALSSYPDPHTQMEADRYAKGQDEDRARLIELLGYDPEKP